MPDETGYERPLGPPYPPTFDGPRPSMAMHWPAPPGGWLEDRAPMLLIADAPADGASTKALPTEALTPEAPHELPARSRPKHLPIILASIAAVVILGGMIAAVTVTMATVRSYQRSHAQTTVGMDQPVRDGAFQFTASQMRCGISEIGSPEDYQAPTGQFCVISLTIKNVGTTPAVFADAIQRAYGPGNVWFSSDSEAGLYANPNPMIFLNDINPGNKVEAFVVYDIPPAGHIEWLEVHENPSTRGAIIKIS